MIIRAQGYMEAQDRRFPFDPVHPLMSQPIIEACLSVPSWEACRGGSDRSFTRRAFTGDLPPTVIERRIKRSEEHTSELQSLMRISYAVFCLKKKKKKITNKSYDTTK